jgi:hypothetical protein
MYCCAVYEDFPMSIVIHSLKEQNLESWDEKENWVFQLLASEVGICLDLRFDRPTFLPQP